MCCIGFLPDSVLGELHIEKQQFARIIGWSTAGDKSRPGTGPGSNRSSCESDETAEAPDVEVA